jgi:hypothetical protein
MFQSGNFLLTIRNPDGSVGLIPESDAATVNLSQEQKQILQNIASAVGGGSGGFNLYGQSLSTAKGSWATVVTKSVLAGETLSIDGFHVWGDADAEWSLEKISGQIGGTRTSASKLSDPVAYKDAIQVVGPDTVTIKVYHWYTGKTVNFRANLEGRIG